ncbi:hypothetical protein M2389_002101 [Microbacterium phyllosphaerae]|nr:hypothetical protein [Microbacterium phyllosphaerae]
MAFLRRRAIIKHAARVRVKRIGTLAVVTCTRTRTRTKVGSSIGTGTKPSTRTSTSTSTSTSTNTSTKVRTGVRTVVRAKVRIRIEVRPVVGSVARGEVHARHRRPIAFRVQDRVDDQLQLRRDLRGQIPPDRMHPVFQTADRDPPAPTRVLILRLLPVGVEHRREILRESLQILHRRRRTRLSIVSIPLGVLIGIFGVGHEPVPARAPRQRDIRRQTLIDRESIPHPLDRTSRRHKPGHPDHPVQQRESQLGPAGRHPLPRQAHRASHQVDDLVDLCRTPHVHPHRPLQQLIQTPAPRRMREVTRIARRDRLHDHRLRATEDRPRTLQHRDPIRIRKPRERIIGQHRIEVSDDPIQKLHSAVHTRKSTRDHRH